MLHTPERGSYDLEDVRLLADVLTFTFSPGPRALCILRRRTDGAFEGFCAARNGMESTMLMIPPAPKDSLGPPPMGGPGGR